MEISTFELLLAPQIPPDLAPGLGNIIRTTLQGYFLQISNLSEYKVKLELEFVAFSPIIPLEPEKAPIENSTLAFFDIDGTNPLKTLNRKGDKKVIVELDIKAHDTGLFILQPNPALLPAGPPAETVYEVRGYVNIHLKSPGSAKLLLTPEQRGTLFKDPADGDPQLSQVIYSLPTATGGALYSLNSKNGEGGEGDEGGEGG
ncbi:hypothetical protein [Acaryochloris marina]|uniref:hypothetical protein n=1 Tax=Acaryochloris marina TaxID=155978 RepID=UPI001BAEAA8E|nr:hypothetical protein [Acaryochloris marina]QUY42129.1 hypothetical protein I1H34_23445 [Acaryochloris marina S15]